MKTKGLIVAGVVILALILLVSGCGTYNSLVNKDQAVKQQWGEVQNQYQRRSDLIPNLVNTVKGYAKQEQQVLTAVVEARARATQVTIGKDVIDDPESLKRFEDAQNQLSGALGRLLAITENYPDLKSNQNFMALQTQLEGTENRIAVARGRFNTSVQDYNTSVRRFPANIFAGIFGFHERPYFQATPGSETPPTVTF
jgi:LemA protein